jgi:hypothetical protein
MKWKKLFSFFSQIFFIIQQLYLSCSDKKFNQNERDEGKRRLENERPKLNDTDIADYDKGGDPVILNHLNADEGQQGNGPPGFGLMMGNLVRFNYHLVTN